MTTLTLRDLGFLGGGGLWTPKIVDTSLWLDASDSTTISLSSPDYVSAWIDKSGKGINVQQITLAKMPTYGRVQLNNINVLSADGSNDELGLPCPIVGTGSFSIFTVTKNVGGLGGRLSIGGGPDSTTGFFAHHYYNPSQGGTKWICAWGSANGGSLSTANADASWHITCSIYNGLTNSSWHDGTAGTSAAKSDSNLSGQWGIFSAGPVVGGQNMQGSIAEVVILGNAAASTTRQTVEGYLAWKWGLALNLPFGHPYKSAAPTA